MAGLVGSKVRFAKLTACLVDDPGSSSFLGLLRAMSGLATRVRRGQLPPAIRKAQWIGVRSTLYLKV